MVLGNQVKSRQEFLSREYMEQRQTGTMRPVRREYWVFSSDGRVSREVEVPFFVVLVSVYIKGVVVRINMPLEVARTTRMVSWG